MAVVFVLPRWVDSRAPAIKPDPATAQRATAPSETKSSSTQDEAETADARSPFADAVEAKARAEAQDLLAELLDVQENLESRGVEEWGVDEYAGVTEQAMLGDERYRERDFEVAIGHYEDALTQALALEQSLPERYEAQLEITREHIEAFDIEAAGPAMVLAELLDPLGLGLEAMQSRVASLPAVAEAVQAAQDAEAAADLELSRDTLKEAATLDSSHQSVASELDRISKALNNQRFNAAMSEGYAALDEQRFDTALARFNRAATLQPGSTEAKAALEELAVAKTADTLARLQRTAKAQAVNEDWTGAIASYEQALQIDAGLRFAQEGLANARPRAELNTAMLAIIDKPERLVDAAILREAQSTLARAQAFADPGPTLSAQKEKVATILEIASTPVPVVLRSDGMTNVTVYKVARFGMMSEQQLNLRPGKYTAVGTRRGYRDVRVVFNVLPGMQPIYIACSEII